MLGAVFSALDAGRGAEKLLQRLDDPACRRRIKAEFAVGLPGWDRFITGDNWEQILIASCGVNHSCEGKSLAALAAERGQNPSDTLFDLMLEENGDILMMAFMMCEADVATVLRHPLSMVGSDAIPSAGKPHPRFYGTFPRILRKYVREDKVDVAGSSAENERIAGEKTGFEKPGTDSGRHGGGYCGFRCGGGSRPGGIS